MIENKKLEEVLDEVKTDIDILIQRIKKERLSERDLYDLTLYFDDNLIPPSFWRWYVVVNKKDVKNKNKRRSKLLKKVARDFFLEYNMQTKVVKDKTIYCRKKKHPHKDD